MSPTLSFLLVLTALISQAFSISIPANPALGLANIISVDTPGDNPLPPSPPGWYNIPGTSLSIKLIGPYGTVIPSQDDALNCLAAAQTEISNTIAAQGDVPIPYSSWQFTEYNVHLAASPPYRGLGTYSQLSSGLKGLLHLMTMAGGPGARHLHWVLSDSVQGIVMKGAIGPYTRVGAVQAGATAVGKVSSGTVASVVATSTASIVGVKELDSS